MMAPLQLWQAMDLCCPGGSLDCDHRWLNVWLAWLQVSGSLLCRQPCSCSSPLPPLMPELRSLCPPGLVPLLLLCTLRPAAPAAVLRRPLIAGGLLIC